MDSLEAQCRQVCELATETATFIREQRALFSLSQVERKGHNDLVSYVDKAAEDRLVKGLSVIRPAGFVAEENTVKRTRQEWQWIVDPLDGTTNFIHGLPCYCISIALMRNETLVMGVINEINTGECFHAWEGSPAFLGEVPIRVSPILHLSDSLIATGFPYTDYSRMQPYMEVFDHCMRHTHGLRRLGSAAVDLAYVACGRFEAFYEYGLNPWDVAAGAFLVQQAGGIVSDFSGGKNYVFGEEIIAGNKPVHEELLGVIQKKFSSGQGPSTP